MPTQLPIYIANAPPLDEAPLFSTSYGLLYQTDCLMLLRDLKKNVLDCIFADPPFNLGKHYGNGEVNDTLRTDEYLQWSRAWLKECIRVLKPGAAIFIYIIPRWGYHFASYLESQGMLFRHWIAVSMKGTFPHSQKLYPAHYGLLYFTKGPPKTSRFAHLLRGSVHGGRVLGPKAVPHGRAPAPYQ